MFLQLLQPRPKRCDGLFGLIMGNMEEYQAQFLNLLVSFYN